MELTVRADDLPACASGRGPGAPRDRPARGDLQQPRPVQRVPPMAGRPPRPREGLRRALRAPPDGATPGATGAAGPSTPGSRPSRGSGPTRSGSAGPRPGPSWRPGRPGRPGPPGGSTARAGTAERLSDCAADPGRDRQGLHRRAGLRRRDGGRPGGPRPGPQHRRRPPGPGRAVADDRGRLAPARLRVDRAAGPGRGEETSRSPPAAGRIAAIGLRADGIRTSSTPGPASRPRPCWRRPRSPRVRPTPTPWPRSSTS